MCTVTILPGERVSEPQFLARAACNRDESPHRVAALPPEVRRFGNRRAIFPIDPASGGTWIAVNDAGLAFTVLNGNPAPRVDNSSTAAERPEFGRTSRGMIIPRLLACSSLEESREQLFALDSRLFAPFRVVMTDGDRLVETEWNIAGRSIELGALRRLDQPVICTSSGLGDDVVRGPRESLFRKFFDEGDRSRGRQDAFHAHQWPDRSEISVCMQRNGAETVSYTTVEIGFDHVSLSYWGASPDRSMEPIRITLSINLAVSR